MFSTLEKDFACEGCVETIKGNVPFYDQVELGKIGVTKGRVEWQWRK